MSTTNSSHWGNGQDPIPKEIQDAVGTKDCLSDYITYFGSKVILIELSDGLMKDPKDKHKLVNNPEAASVVREIFEMAGEGMKLVEIGRVLNERGVETLGQYNKRKNPTSRKDKDISDEVCWNHNNLRSILKQEMYYGAVVGHKRQAVGIGGKHTTVVPKEEQFIVEGIHEGIVTKEEFLKAQAIFQKRGKAQCIVPKT